ncbi:tRNA pseudouridine synthase PUS10 [Vairimorpha necatrix]|uniref:tRNA pseudouridine(55) synthase n=1 Tax=Vairimorpha necatrix TaxID=6039 RepID=A0AAX4JF98_9MICR
MNRLKEFIEENKTCIHENIIYCFKSESLKTILKAHLIQGDIDKNFYSEITIDEEKIKLRNSPIFIYGEYIKLSREMTQTPLRISGKLKCKKSVSEFTKQIKEYYQSKEVKFIPSGREDIDVKMIGGRPFLLKIIEPKRNFYSFHIPLILDKDVKLQNMMLVTKEIRNFILTGEKNERKLYQLLVASKEKLQFNKKYELLQKTPLRVLHRRANLVRNKEIEILESEHIKDPKDIISDIKDLPQDIFYYRIVLRASAGAYIKEFVHGDLGRTRPSLSSKTNICDLLELDVLEVEKKEIDPKLIINK